MRRDYSHLSLSATDPSGPPPAAAANLAEMGDPEDYSALDQRHRPVNVRFVALLLLGVFLLVGGLWIVHERQMRAMAAALLERSEHYRQQGDLPQSVEYLSDYVRLVPEDTAALRRLAFTLDELAESPEQRFDALRRFEELLRKGHDGTDVRHRLVDLAMYFGRFGDAIVHLNALLDASPGESELHLLLGRCYEANQNIDAAIAAYADAVRHDPRAFEAYERMAVLLREQAARQDDGGRSTDRTEPAEADVRLLDRLVAANPRSFQAYVLRARAQRDKGRLREALVDANKAWQLAPDEPDVLILAADLLTADQQGTTAETYFRRDEVQSRLESAVLQDPDDPRLYHALAKLDLASRRWEPAAQWLRQGLEIDPSSIDLRWLLADFLISRRDFEGAEAEIAELRRLQAPHGLLQFLHARVAMAHRDWLTARDQLELARTAGIGSAAFMAEVHLALARCYRELGQAELEIAACRRALRVQSASAEARFSLARALAEQGRIDEARKLCDDVMDVSGVPALAARLSIQQNLERPEADRDWGSVERLIESAARDRESEIDARILRAELLEARGELESARALLQESRERQPGHIEFWLASAELESRAGDHAAAAALIDRAEQQLGPRPETVTARIRLAALREETAHEELTDLEQVADDFSGADRFAILVELGEAWAQIDGAAEAIRIWQRAAELELNHLALWLRLTELAVRSGAADAAAEFLKQVRRIEGEGGFYALLGEAAHCMLLVRRGEREKLIRARELIEQAGRVPAGSPLRVELALAEVCELEGADERAVEHYRRAIELGERSPQVVGRAVQILYSRHRYLDAEKLIEDFQQRTPVSVGRELGRLAAELSLRARNRPRAIERARHAVAEDSADFRDHLWLGQLLAAAGRPDEAEAALRRASELAPAQPEVWVALVRLCAANGREQQVPQLLNELSAHVPSDALPQVLAQCYEAAGDDERAAQAYEEIVRSRPDDAPSLWTAASFYIRTDAPYRAEPLLRRLTQMEAAEDDGRLIASARRALAVVLASGGDYRGFMEAMALLEQNASAAGQDPEDVRVKARLLATRPERRYRSDAVVLFESLDERSRLSLDDVRQLAELYLGLGDWQQARRLLQALLAARTDDPDLLAFAVRAMIDNGEIDNATQQWLEMLKGLERPETLRTAGLEARLLVARGRVTEAIDILRRQIPEPMADSEPGLDQTASAAEILAEISAWQEGLGESVAAEALADEAERLHRRVLESRPRHALQFASFLGSRWRADEALSICELAWKESPPEQVAAACIDVLRDGRPRPEHFERVRTWIADAARRNPDSANLQFHLANAAHLQGDFEVAEECYRRALELSPESAVTRNELALLLALRGGDTQDALELINRAIELAGPQAFLLDTRATVYLAMDRSDAAIEDLRQAIEEAPTAARHFHMAQALLARDDQSAAKRAYQQGVAAGLHEGSLHPLERAGYRQLQARIQKL